MADRNGTSHINYIARGQGQAVIFLHGIAASLHDWDSLLPAVAAAGFRAFAIDLPGHGESEKPEDPDAYTASGIEQALQAWLDNLKDGPPYILIGHSFGGYLSLRYALRHPEQVQGLLLIDPYYSLSQPSPLLRWFLPRPTLGIRALQLTPLPLIDRVLGWDPVDTSHFSTEARWQVAVDYKRASPHILNYPRTISDLTPRLGQIQAPTRVIWGTHDLTLRPASFPQLVSAIPKATGHPIEGSGHQPHIGRPEQVRKLALEFLNSLRPE
jgi:4,5:9,10-diseco-3-hydroxy-5,9,17-trioxoandrosta-1(10),2-diene-4-oate hydrolase